ncbi:MAG: BrnA antitoxin family protein [Arenimonas sp.]|nr:BrnA antitoxin family protein [Arenimonas sp.]
MTANNKPMANAWQDPDDAPDLSQTPWREKLEATPVRVGRPKSESPKVSTTIRLDLDVLEGFRKTGPGWQSRINAALREWLAEKG